MNLYLSPNKTQSCVEIEVDASISYDTPPHLSYLFILFLSLSLPLLSLSPCHQDLEYTDCIIYSRIRSPLWVK